MTRNEAMTDDESLAWEEYDIVARMCAKRNKNPIRLGDALPDLISSRCHELINEDPEAFCERVRAMQYAIAMDLHITF